MKEVITDLENNFANQNTIHIFCFNKIQKLIFLIK